tara:strand:- start:314 stop:850 length:537 start_codon:yes stop_codon:yes gene_type:complete
MFDLTKIKKKNICIIGLMGSGKSIIGKDLSKSLNLKFYDTDKEIELKTKKSIGEIFKEDGESYFRDIEAKLCAELLNQSNCVISLGGGSIINKKIRKIVKQNSYSIYLQVKITNLLDRLNSSKKRPLLNKHHDRGEILQKIYNDRQIFYNRADFIVDNNYDKFQVLKKIKSKLDSYAE